MRRHSDQSRRIPIVTSGTVTSDSAVDVMTSFEANGASAWSFSASIAVVLAAGTVLFEAKDGPYTPLTPDCIQSR